MRIAYVANVRLPTERAHGLQIMEMCRAFSREGHAVRLFVPKRRNFTDETPWERYGMTPDFEIVEVPIFDFVWFDRWFGRAAVWLNALQFMSAARKAVRTYAPDVVYARDPWFTGVDPRARYVYEAHDFPERVTPLHRRLWARAARIVTVTAGLKRAFAGAGVGEGKLVVAHDGVDAAKFDVRETKAEARARLGLPSEPFIAIYTGHLYPYKGADDLLEACARLRPSTRVLFVGGRPDDLARLKARSEALGAGNAVFTGPVRHADVPLYLRAADAAVLPTRATDRHAAEFLSPLKLFEYLAAGKAIVATSTPSVREVLDDASASFVPPSDPAALAAALNALADVPAKREALEREAVRLAAGRSWTGRAARVLDGLPDPHPVTSWLRRYRTELLVAALAFAVRAAYVIFLPQYRVEGGDSSYYLALADRIRGIPQSPDLTRFYPLFYPWLLAVIRSVFGEGLVWIRLTQSLLSAATVFIMALCARRWLGRGAGAAAGLIGAVYVPMILESGIVYTETSYAFFLTAAVCAAAYAVHEDRRRTALAAGVAFALAGLTRELGFYQAVIFAAWAAIARRSWKLAFAIALPTLVAFGGIAVRNASVAPSAEGAASAPLVAKRYEAALAEPGTLRNLFAPDRWHLYPEGLYLYLRLPHRISTIGPGVPIDGKPHPKGDVVYHFNPAELVARQPALQVFAKVMMTLLHWALLALAAYGLWRGSLPKEAKIGFGLAIAFAAGTILLYGIKRVQGFEGLEPLARYRFPTEPLIILLAVSGALAWKTESKK